MENQKPKNSILSGITYVFDMAYSVLLTYSKFVLLAIVFLVSAEVISRKFLGTSIRWSEEVALFFMVWMAFISMAIGVQKHLHIAIEYFYDRLPKTLAALVAKLDILVVLGIGIIMVMYGANLVQVTMNSTLPATNWPAGTLYLMIPVSGVFIIYFSVLEFFGLEHYEHKNLYQDDVEGGKK